MKNTKYKIFIIIIIATSFVLRFYKLSSFPASLSIDEVSFGYNAKSILETGRDEYGKFLPLSFRALGDFKLPVQVYLTSISISLFGFNEFSIRFFVALFGSLTPLVVILTLRELKFTSQTSLLTGLWVAILPWHIVYSRSTFEVITAFFFVITGLYFYLLFKKTNKIWELSVCLALLGLSVWTYNAMRVFMPLLLTFLFASDYKIFRKRLNHSASTFTSPLFISFLFFGTLVFFSITNRDILGRANDLWLGNDPYLSQRLASEKFPTYLIFMQWVNQYLQYFDLRFIFWKGLNLTSPNRLGLGILNAVDLPFIAAGIYFLAVSSDKYIKRLALFWLLAGPLAASFTRGDGSSIRTLIWLFFFVLVMAHFFENLLKKKVGNIILAIYTLFFSFNILYAFDVYTNAFPKYNADIWHYGYKEAINYVCSNHTQYNHVIITDKYGRIEPNIQTIPHLYLLVHCNLSPSTYHLNKAIFNVEIKKPNWFEDSKLENTLLIGSHWDFPENFPKDWILKTIYFPSGEPALHLVETSPDKYYQNKY